MWVLNYVFKGNKTNEIMAYYWSLILLLIPIDHSYKIAIIGFPSVSMYFKVNFSISSSRMGFHSMMSV